MIGKGGEFLMSQAETVENLSSAKWRGVKLVLMTSTVVIFSIPVALLPFAIRRIQPTAEFVFLVFAPGLWNSVSTWITAPCLYVLLNIVLVTLGVISRSPPTANDDQFHNFVTFNSFSAETEIVLETNSDADKNYIIIESKLADPDPLQNDLSPAASTPAPQVQNPAAAPVFECRSTGSSCKDLKAILTPAPALYAKKSIMRRSTAKLSNLSREFRGSREMLFTESRIPTAPKTSPDPPLVVFEISTDVGDYYMHQHDEVIEMVESDGELANKLHRCKDGGMSSSSEELYLKAESFIGDFYRQLKIQRENSWKRFCGIYRRSC